MRVAVKEVLYLVAQSLCSSAALNPSVYALFRSALSLGATAAPISRNYIAGLRGSPDEVMELINLTVDPEIAIGKYR